MIAKSERIGKFNKYKKEIVMNVQVKKTSNLFTFLAKSSFNAFAVASVALLIFGGSHSFAADKKVHTSKPAVVAQKVSLNSADAKTLASILNGVGLKKAKLIVAYRQKHGKFKSIDQLTGVKGIGVSILEKNKSLITL